MKPSPTEDKEFIGRLTEFILVNLEDEGFGGKNLAKLSGISRMEINRRLHSAKNIYINEFIREVRLQKALKILQNEEFTVSEVAYKVGFSSPSYFNKCFHEYFGYPPGKVEKVHGVSSEKDTSSPVPVKRVQKRFWLKIQSLTGTGILFLSILIVMGAILVYQKVFKPESLNDLRSSDGKISIAVMPFRNMTNDTTWKYWQDGIQINLISSLSNSLELKVTDSESILRLLQRDGFTNYASITPSVASKISREFDANVFICGSIIKAGDKIRVNAQIISTDKKQVLQTFESEGPEKGELIFKNIDLMRQEMKDFLQVTFMKNSDPKTDTYFLDPIKSPEAYRYMVSARKAERNSDFSTAIDMYMQAIKIDSAIYDAYALIAVCYGTQGDWKKCKEWMLNYYGFYGKLNMYNKLFADYLFAIIFKTPYDAIRYAEQMTAINPQAFYNYVNLGDEYNRIFQYDKAITEYEKASVMNGAFLTEGVYESLGKAYHNTGNYKEEKKLYKKAVKDYPDSPLLKARQAILELSERDTTLANQYIGEYKSLRRFNQWSEAKIVNGLAVIYLQGGYPDIAEKYYRLAHSLEPDNTEWMNNLGFFLIDEGRNIEEGLMLTDKALLLSPDDYLLLDSKAWGLYKHGKPDDALALMQKSWDLRIQQTRYDHTAFLHLEEIKTAVSGQR
jgi:AraC-like DNA-binding protein/Tfp pilus assembly protein PilF/TolB-like protein